MSHWSDDDTHLVGALVVHAMERQVLIESLVFQQIGVSRVWVDVLNVSAIRTVFVVVTIWRPHCERERERENFFLKYMCLA